MVTEPVASLEAADGPKWNAEWAVEKYHGPSAAVRAGTAVPYEVIRRRGNLMLLGGADLLWRGLIGTTFIIATTGLKNTVFNNAEAAIHVGDSAVAAVATQTNLQATSQSSNRDAAPMEATYPTHTTGAASTASRDVTFRGIFTTAMGNFVWNEWGVGNSTSTTGTFKGRMLNRKVEALGEKTAAATWTFTVKISIT